MFSVHVIIFSYPVTLAKGVECTCIDNVYTYAHTKTAFIMFILAHI